MNINFDLAICSLDGLGNEYVTVAREVGSDGPWWIVDHVGETREEYADFVGLRARLMRRVGASAAELETMDRDVVRQAIARALARQRQGEKYALAMAFPSLRLSLPGWEDDGPLVIPYTSDGDTPQRRILEQLVRHTRTRPWNHSAETGPERFVPTRPLTLAQVDAQVESRRRYFAERRFWAADRALRSARLTLPLGQPRLPALAAEWAELQAAAADGGGGISAEVRRMMAT